MTAWAHRPKLLHLCSCAAAGRLGLAAARRPESLPPPHITPTKRTRPQLSGLLRLWTVVRRCPVPVRPSHRPPNPLRPSRPLLQITQREVEADGPRGKPRPPAPPEGRLYLGALLLRPSSLSLGLLLSLLFQGNSSPPLLIHLETFL